MKKAPFIVLGLFATIVAAFYLICWNMRDTPERQFEESAAFTAAVSQAKTVDEIAKLFRETIPVSVTRPVFSGRFPFVSFPTRPLVAADSMATDCERLLVSFGGKVSDNALDPKEFKRLVDVAQILDPLCTPTEAQDLRERILDANFIIGDYDGAITMLESGRLTRRDADWQRAMAAKLRAHRAMEKNDLREAIRQFQAFCDYMLSDKQADFSDPDPVTLVEFSREWVVARNYARIAKLYEQLADADNKAKYVADAKKYFVLAREKAKDDPKAIAELDKDEKNL